MTSKNTTIVNCKCAHSQQDKMYGVGNRVANATLVGPHVAGQVQVRCTVCSKIHTVKSNSLK